MLDLLDYLKNIKINMNALETTLYVLCGGFFGVFSRWMQNMLAFDENGLPESSFWNIAVPLVCVAAAYLYHRMIKGLHSRRFTHEEGFTSVFSNTGRLFAIARYAIGALMVIGAALLFASSEVDKNSLWLRILSVLCVLAGVSYSLFLREANLETPAVKKLCLYTLCPIVAFGFWLVTTYKINAYNSVTWSFGYEIIAVCFIIIALYRIAGYPYGKPDFNRTLFFVMLGGFFSVAVLADERDLGMSVMFLATAGYFLDLTWIMVHNMHQKAALNEPITLEQSNGLDAHGFEHLNR
ncbi:MAG: hypothetical protein MJ135_03120 [Oscillospiraceae bacterium]|nr:hypothetical protein [Oscillospiraceae bacterium]